MSTFLHQVKCPQCGNQEADREFNCRSSEEEILCARCGYRESWKVKRDEDSEFLGWNHEIFRAMGALWYRASDGIAFAGHSLYTIDELAEAERWLKEQLAAGTVEEDTARLTRWNEEASRFDLVIGTFDHAGRMNQVVADLGLNPIRSSPGQAVRFAILPGKAAVVGKLSYMVIPVLHYLNADPSNGKYTKTTDGSMPPIEYELEYLAVSPSELNKISKLQEQAPSRYSPDVVFVSHGDFGRGFDRVSSVARWTQDPAIAKRVLEIAIEASSKLVASCAGRSDVELFEDFWSRTQTSKTAESTAEPPKRGPGTSSQIPVMPEFNNKP